MSTGMLVFFAVFLFVLAAVAAGGGGGDRDSGEI